VDTVITIPNERCSTQSQGTRFQRIVQTGRRCAASSGAGHIDIITVPVINVDFADVKAIMEGME